MLSLGQQVNVRPHIFDPKQDYLGAMVVEVDFLMKKKLVDFAVYLVCLCCQPHRYCKHSVLSS